jgi:hypothetical protein
VIRVAGIAALLLGAGLLVGCVGQDAVENEDESASSLATAPEGIVYYHGMSHLGINPTMLAQTVAPRDLLAPQLSDSELEAPPAAAVRDFVNRHDTATVSGYSLGRVPVLRLMKSPPPKMARVVMIDPTYDTASGLGSHIGGPIAEAWLDGSAERTFLLVYGDTTTSLGGEQSYVSALAHHPRAELCYVPGDHERFRADDMAYAVIATSCADLRAHLTH